MSTTALSGRKRTLVIVAAVVLLVVVVLLIISPWRDREDQAESSSSTETSDTTSDASSSPALTGSATAPPTTAPAPQDPIDIDDGVRVEVEGSSESLVGEVFTLTVPISPDDDVDLSAELAGVVSDTYLSELEAERLEFEAEGWTRTGAYRLGSPEILDFQEDSHGSTATVRVCVDSSAVVVTSADGAEVAGASGDTAWNIFVLSKPADTDSWILVGRTFPNDPAC
jgi:hypothetical protein